MTASSDSAVLMMSSGVGLKKHSSSNLIFLITLCDYVCIKCGICKT